MKEALDKVKQFHETFHCFIEEKPSAVIPKHEFEVRLKLLQEELDEYRQAAEAGDLVAVADALTDLLYVLLGTYIAHGLQDVAADLFDEVHRSNMSKLDRNGQPVLREDGKVLKSELFSRPNLEAILYGKQP